MRSTRARAEVGDACDLAQRHSKVAGVFSLFGLQQLPDAHLALANWVQALTPGQLSQYIRTNVCQWERSLADMGT